MLNAVTKIGKTVLYELGSHSQEILTGLAISGVVLTGIETVNATIATQKALEEQEIDISDKKAVAKVALPKFAPAIFVASGTIGCILCAHNVSAKRQAALASMYAISERGVRDLSEKVKDINGENKLNKIKEDILKDHVVENPPKEGCVINTGHGNSLCFDNWTGRYFYSDIDILKRAEIDLNEDCMNGFYVSLNDFYDRIGLPYITEGENIGWDFQQDGKIDLGMTWTNSPADPYKACLIIDPHPGLRYKD